MKNGFININSISIIQRSSYQFQYQYQFCYFCLSIFPYQCIVHLWLEPCSLASRFCAWQTWEAVGLVWKGRKAFCQNQRDLGHHYPETKGRGLARLDWVLSVSFQVPRNGRLWAPFEYGNTACAHFKVIIHLQLYASCLLGKEKTYNYVTISYV